MKSIQTQVIITGIRSKVDKSLGISLTTPELTTNEKAIFMDLQGVNCDMLITPLDENVETEKINKEMDTKTPSQRLRAVLFVFYQQANETKSFEEFYKEKMEKFIDIVKSKLEPR